MSNNLFSIVSSNLQNAMDNGKTPIGYTVKNYQGVLAALQKAKIVYNQVTKTRASTNIGSRRYTMLMSAGLQGADDGSGFIVHQNSNEISYQALCTVKDYMSFFVDYMTGGSDNKKARGWVGVERPLPESHPTKGISLQATGISYPPVAVDNTTITRMSQTLGGDSQPCTIGVGLSLGNLAYNFMKRFFPDLGLTQHNIETLASQGYLNAEVLIPKSDSEAYVLHARVTMKHEINDQSASFQVWIPIPILLLNDFKDVGTVMVEAGTGQQEKVGQQNVTFPFANSRYNHETASIENLMPGLLKAYISDEDDMPVKYIGSNLCNSGVTTQARVRLYFRKDAKERIEKVIGKSIPEAYTTELFKGQKDVIKVEPISGVGTMVASGFKYWDELGAEIGLSGGLVERAVGMISRYESGGKYESWGWAKDDQGLSAGFLQFTQLAGGIKDYCDIYKQLQAKDNSAPPMSAAMYADVVRLNKTQNWTPLMVHAAQFAKQAATETGKMAQILTWEGVGPNKLKRKFTVKWYKIFGCSTACQFMAIFGAINHLPTWFDGTNPPFGGKGYCNWVDEIKKITNPVQKARALEAVHWIEAKKFYKYKGYKGCTVMATQINSFLADIDGNWPGGGSPNVGWRRRMKKSIELWGESNVDLNGWDTISF